jgi:phage gp36-like protein
MPIPSGYSSYYVTPTDIRNALASTSNLPGSAAVLQDADLNDAISEAQSEVDGKLANRYGPLLPFAAGSVPTLVVNITRDIAAYLATLTYRRGNPIQPGDPVQLRYTQAEKKLDAIAAGTIELPTPDGATGTQEAANPTGVVANPVDGDLWNAADFDLRERVGVWPAWPW